MSKLRVIAGGKRRGFPPAEPLILRVMREHGFTGPLTPKDREGYLMMAYGDPNIELDAEVESMLPEAIQKLPKATTKIK
jgi:hypothetical protein